MANTQCAEIQHVESKFFQNLFFGFALLALVSVLISFAGRQIGSEISMGGHTDDATVHEIVIGSDIVSVPANMIRFPEQRRDGIADRMDLYAQWPSLSGYTPASKPIFNNQDKAGRLLFISFEQRVMTRDMSGRFTPIYKSMIESAGERLPNGLVRYHLPEKAGFLDEYLYVGNYTSERPFVARCLAEDVATDSLAACDRDYHAGQSLSMMVRFSPKLLENWQALDIALSAFAKSAIKSELSEVR